jgi:coenzyme PQQ precursor peptide PqqA
MISELARPRQARIDAKKGEDMAWTTPTFEEVSLCCEINSYVSAKI